MARLRNYKSILIPFLLIAVVSCSKGGGYGETGIGKDAITGDIKDLVEKKPVFYNIKVGEAKIDFFVIQINGEVKAYLNRCRKCFNSGLGFGFEDADMRCKACNVRFPIEEISHGIGSCYPIPAVISIKDNSYTVKSSDLYSAYQNNKPKL